MDLVLCDGSKVTLEDGTVGTFADKSGAIIVLTVYGDCWKDVATQDVKVTFDPDHEAHLEYETTTTDVAATCDTKQFRKVQAVKICKDKFGNIVKCPPR